MAGAQLRQQPGCLREPAWIGVEAEQFHTQSGTQRLDNRLVGRGLSLRVARAGEEDALVLHAGTEVPHEARLADARLTRDEDDLASTAARPAVRLLQRMPRVLTSDEGDVRKGHVCLEGGGRWADPPRRPAGLHGTKDRLGLGQWIQAELAFQDSHEVLILARRSSPVAGERVELDEAAMDLLAEIVDFQIALRLDDRAGVLALGCLILYQGRQRLQRHPLAALAFRRDPGLVLGIVR